MIEAMKQALKAFEKIHEGCGYVQEDNLHKHAKELATLVRKDCIFAIKDLNQAIEDAKKSKWVGLTLKDMPDDKFGRPEWLEGVNWAETKLKEKNE